MNIKVYEAFLDENFKGVYALSFVNKPAMQSEFFLLSEIEDADENIIKLSVVDDEEQIVVGAIAIPEKLILRKDQFGAPFFVYFTEKTIRDSASGAFSSGAFLNNNLEHSSKKIDGVMILETWVIDDPEKDKANLLYGFNYPKGTWMATYKVADKGLWRDIKYRKINGFSLEGHYNTKFAYYLSDFKLSAENFKSAVIAKRIASILNSNKIKFLNFIAESEIEKRYNDFYKNVNMTLDEMEKWSASPCSRLASLNRKPVERVIKLLSTPKNLWGLDEYEEAGKVVAFVQRMKENSAGAPASDECRMSKRTISLLNWGYNPNSRMKFNEECQDCLELAVKKASFDFHGTLTTPKGLALLEWKIKNNWDVYIITASTRELAEKEVYNVADKYGVPHSKVFFTGSNKAKVEKIQELGVDVHIDNNQDVLDQIEKLGIKGELI